jgi:hypothetical protein
MQDIEWEPTWRTPGVPSLGDYIQVKAHHIFDPEDIKIFEGTVIKSSPDKVEIAPKPASYPYKIAIAWRKAILRESQTEIRKAEIDA